LLDDSQKKGRICKPHDQLGSGLSLLHDRREGDDTNLKQQMIETLEKVTSYLFKQKKELEELIKPLSQNLQPSSSVVQQMLLDNTAIYSKVSLDLEKVHLERVSRIKMQKGIKPPKISPTLYHHDTVADEEDSSCDEETENFLTQLIYENKGEEQEDDV